MIFTVRSHVCPGGRKARSRPLEADRKNSWDVDHRADCHCISEELGYAQVCAHSSKEENAAGIVMRRYQRASTW